mmetsp:Transcript_26688/g.55890  ORF Transcript_26688/g.55890 Transcript_26688/m.55890 type:complete len:222 (-) Transcript_26688:1002-1667(-)
MSILKRDNNKMPPNSCNIIWNNWIGRKNPSPRSLLPMTTITTMTKPPCILPLIWFPLPPKLVPFVRPIKRSNTILHWHVKPFGAFPFPWNWPKCCPRKPLLRPPRRVHRTKNDSRRRTPLQRPLPIVATIVKERHRPKIWKRKKTRRKKHHLPHPPLPWKLVWINGRRKRQWKINDGPICKMPLTAHSVPHDWPIFHPTSLSNSNDIPWDPIGNPSNCKSI